MDNKFCRNFLEKDEVEFKKLLTKASPVMN